MSSTAALTLPRSSAVARTSAPGTKLILPNSMPSSCSMMWASASLVEPREWTVNFPPSSDCQSGYAALSATGKNFTFWSWQKIRSGAPEPSIRP